MRGFRGMGISYPTDQLMPGDTSLYPAAQSTLAPAQSVTMVPNEGEFGIPGIGQLSPLQIGLILGGSALVLYLLLRRN